MTLDVFLRGCAAGVLLLCSSLFGTQNPLTRKHVSVVCLCVCLGPYLLLSSPSVTIEAGVTLTLLLFVAGVIPVLLYWAIIELFIDDAHLHPWQVLAAVLIVGASWLSHTLSQLQSQILLQLLPLLSGVRGGCVLILFVHAMNVVISTDADDLIAGRRLFRRWFLIWVLTIGMTITALEMTALDSALPPWAFMLQAAAIFLSSGGFLLWSVNIRSDIWITHAQRPDHTKSDNPANSILANRIEEAMSNGLWRQEGLTITQVAAHLNSQEHRIRSAINQGMGHKNFASYVNTYRIDAAKAMLSDPLLAERTVLSIAYEVGFASLGPFNRAFKANTNMTPTAFRKTRLQGE